MTQTDIERGIEAELTRRMLAPIRPLMLYVGAAHLCTGAMWWVTGSASFQLLFFAATAASVFRGIVLALYHRRDGRAELALPELNRWAAAHAVAAILCNLVLTCFTIASYLANEQTGFMLALCFAAAQASTVATRNPRPWLAITQVTLTLAPLAIAFALENAITFWAMSVLIGFYLLSLCETIIENSRNLRELLRSRRLADWEADHDALTGLINRRRFDEVMNEAVQGEAPFGLLLLDLDGFKPVNDTHGHAAGDEVLRQTAARLKNAAGPTAIAARIGGDEFAVVLPGVDRASDVKEIADLIVLRLSEPMAVSGSLVRVGASIGAAFSSHADRMTAGELKRLADEALYASKRAGKGRACLTPPRLAYAG